MRSMLLYDAITDLLSKCVLLLVKHVFVKENNEGYDENYSPRVKQHRLHGI